MGLRMAHTRSSTITVHDVEYPRFAVPPARGQAGLVSYHVQVEAPPSRAARRTDPTDLPTRRSACSSATRRKDYANELSEQCVHRPGRTRSRRDLQTDITTKVGGQYDAAADSTVIGYTTQPVPAASSSRSATSSGLTPRRDLNKNDEQLTQAVQKAMQYLMDNGYLRHSERSTAPKTPR